MPLDACRHGSRNAGECCPHCQEVTRLKQLLERCYVVLGNLAMERENPAVWQSRWPISHEPLRADAKALLPLLDAAVKRN